MFKFANGDVYGETVTLYVKGEGTQTELKAWIDDTLSPAVEFLVGEVYHGINAKDCNFCITITGGSFAEIGEFMGQLEEAVQTAATEIA